MRPRARGSFVCDLFVIDMASDSNFCPHIQLLQSNLQVEVDLD